ncbi:MAG TPA: hypothetical protein VGB37_15675 [Candidatus Lokiarchaeia archaeon]
MGEEKIQKMLADLRNDNTSGANELIDQAIQIIKIFLNSEKDEKVDLKDRFIKLSREIMDSKPSIAPLINTIGFLTHDLISYNKENILNKIEQFYVEKTNREKNLEYTFQKFISKEYKNRAKIMLISYSSTLLNLLLKFKEFQFEIYILESRPLLEGHRTAETLAPYFKTHIIIDTAIGAFIEVIDCVFLGIDSILNDGSIVNKIGSYPLAVLARENKKPVYAVGDSFKYNLKSHFGQKIVIETNPSTEVYNKEILNENLSVHNYYFDITPSKYITKIISDLGEFTPKKFVSKVKKTLSINWFESFLKNNK